MRVHVVSAVEETAGQGQQPHTPHPFLHTVRAAEPTHSYALRVQQSLHQDRAPDTRLTSIPTTHQYQNSTGVVASDSIYPDPRVLLPAPWNTRRRK